MASFGAADPVPLTSGNTRVKNARKLARRISRTESRLFLADGPKAVEGALSVAGCVVEVFATIAASEQYAALRAAGVTLLAADGAGERDLDAVIDDGTLTRPTAWLFGNEAWGLPAEIRALADEVVSVPIHGRAESLNLATAAAVFLDATATAQRTS